MGGLYINEAVTKNRKPPMLSGFPPPFTEKQNLLLTHASATLALCQLPQSPTPLLPQDLCFCCSLCLKQPAQLFLLLLHVSAPLTVLSQEVPLAVLHQSSLKAI